MKQFIILLLMLFAGVTIISADDSRLSDDERAEKVQEILSTRGVQFVIDQWGGGTVMCKQLDKVDDGYVINNSKPEMEFERGYTFTPIAFINNYLYVFKDTRRYYAVSMSKLQFENSDDAEALSFMLPKSHEKLSSFGARFYGTSAALWVMIVVMLIAAAVTFVYLKGQSETVRPYFLAVLPAAIFIFSAIEIYGYCKFEDDFFWWCDYDRYGFWGSLFRVIPFAVLVAAQVLSIKFYERGLFLGSDNTYYSGERSISIKPALISLVVCLPATFITAILLSFCGLANTIVMDIIVTLVFFASLGYGIYISYKRNVESFGAKMSLWVTVFSVVYILGCIISAIAMITLIFKIIMQILVVLFALIILAAMTTSKKKDKKDR